MKKLLALLICVLLVCGTATVAFAEETKIVFPAVIAGVFGYIIKDRFNAGYPVVFAFTVLTAVGAAVSQIGDLSASAVKRNHDIKDYGNLIPGHGGILDRFDSMIFTAPMIYFIAVLFMTSVR